MKKMHLSPAQWQFVPKIEPSGIWGSTRNFEVPKRLFPHSTGASASAMATPLNELAWRQKNAPCCNRRASEGVNNRNKGKYSVTKI